MPKGVYPRKPGRKNNREPRPIAERFWPKVAISEGCWLWTAAKMPNGYGVMGAGKHGRTPLKAHRVSWELHFGPIPSGLLVCHHCDVPACVRPSHLFLGTASENMQDMHQKGRRKAPTASPWRRGSRHPLAKVTPADVQTIRARYQAGGISQDKLAVEYGISQSNVSLIVRSEHWTWL